MAPTRTSTAPQDPKDRLSVVSTKWDASNKGFLTDEEQVLRNLDVEGTGTLTSKQLSAFADQYGALREENKQIKRGLALLTLLIFVGTVVASVMASGTDSPLSVNTSEVHLPLAALPFSVTGPTEGANFHRTVGAIDTVNSTSLVITTTTGDKVTWPGSDGNKGEVTISLADGTTWNKNAACVNCAATSVVETDEIIDGLREFANLLGVGSGRRKVIYLEDSNGFEQEDLSCLDDWYENYDPFQ